MDLLNVVSYSYGGRDNLASYDSRRVRNDIVGVTSYRGWNYEYENGTQLARIWKLNAETGEEFEHTFTYNADGMRIQRTANETGTTYTYNYIYAGDKLS